ncbi:hypothetical protein [Colwellia hornerae]|uniref:Uncharacterized protein n=1 Tax=Colwellia hornerae TaxID=89402 RepID=A0A5C6QFL5_9GAMM|nr:hypothetical protein [Colwellia hornerae]TWX52262.1 hypothetical protein ESZ28_12680 [Colwellia hornerae]TWX57821.1 hypothetical protein ESZ26_12645 [Colwellia hornerae]TWX67523.1 hypothetical protein ESZ27_08515 [Colwellia hornerae]
MSNWRAGEMSFKYLFEADKRYFIRLTAELGNIGAYVSTLSISGAYSFAMFTEEVALNELKGVKKN